MDITERLVEDAEDLVARLPATGPLFAPTMIEAAKEIRRLRFELTKEMFHGHTHEMKGKKK